MRRDLNIDERAAIAAALWLVLRDENVRRAFVDLARDHRDHIPTELRACETAYAAIVGVQAK